MKRTAVLLPVLGLVFFLAPTLAWSHGGTIVASGKNDAYALTVQASDTVVDGQPYTDFTVYPVRRSNGAPESDAEVTLSIDGGPVQEARQVGDGFELLLPSERDLEWREQQVSATVDGPAGFLEISGSPLGLPSSEPPAWIVPVTIVVFGGLIVIALLIMRRRRGADAD